ncbi:hypothetical protein U1Q18_020198 [Sarracenia purpurea var. burkii]
MRKGRGGDARGLRTRRVGWGCARVCMFEEGGSQARGARRGMVRKGVTGRTMVQKRPGAWIGLRREVCTHGGFALCEEVWGLGLARELGFVGEGGMGAREP